MDKKVGAINIISNTGANFNQIDRRGGQDVELTLKAKGLLYYFYTLPKDWTIYVSELVKHHADGITAIRGALKELIEAGYVVAIENREKGKFGGVSYKVFPTRVKVGEDGYYDLITEDLLSPLDNVNGKTVCGKPVCGKPNTTEEILNKTDTKDNIYNSAFNTPKQNTLITTPSKTKDTTSNGRMDISVLKINTALATNNFKGIGVQHLAYYFKHLYMARYKTTDVLGFTVINTQNLFTLLLTEYNLTVEKVCRDLPSWFERYHSLGYARANFKTFSVNCMKQTWIIENIISNTPKQVGAYKKQANLDDKTIPKDVKERNAKIRESYKDVVCDEVF